MDELLKQELRGGWLDIGKPFQPLDFLGVALGAYFFYAGATERAPPVLTMALGALMIYIHSRRFFYAPKTRAGLLRLLQQLEVTPEEIVGTL